MNTDTAQPFLKPEEVVNPIISELVDLATNDIVGPRLNAAASRFGYPHAKGMTMSLLAWLRDNGRPPGRPPVSESRLNRRMSSDMAEFIQTVHGLALLVTATDQVLRFGVVLRFSSTLPPDERADCARQAYETYKPCISVTWIAPPRSGQA